MLLRAVLRRSGAFAAERRRLLSRDAQQQTRRLLSIDGTDRQTDRQTLDRFIDPALHTMR